VSADDRQAQIRQYAGQAAQHYRDALTLRANVDDWPERFPRDKAMKDAQLLATLSVAAAGLAKELRAQIAEEADQ
jgi:hypothetical protein